MLTRGIRKTLKFDCSFKVVIADWQEWKGKGLEGEEDTHVCYTDGFKK